MAGKRRSGEAQAALGRKAGPMRHRLQPRGGARNEQADLFEEWDDMVAHDQGCQLPPPGWWCSREPGHEGPCAARPIKE